MGTLRAIVIASLSVSVVLVASAAHAEPRGLMLAPSNLPAASQSQLRQQIASARRARPDAFQAVERLEAEAPRLHAARRGNVAPMGPAFKALGPDALLPMLELLSFRSRGRADLSDAAWLALRVGVLEALGQLRDERTLPVLRGILASSESHEPEVLRAAATALGALASDEVTRELVALSRAPGTRGDALRVGLGACRRAAAADELARLLAAEQRPEQQTALIGALSAIGNAWAWQTPSVRVHANEEQHVRETAARALVQAYVRGDAQLRTRAGTALLVVDAPGTAALIAEAGAAAEGENRAALAKLEREFAGRPR